MKEISRQAIENQVRKERKAGRDWCQGGSGRYYAMMIDVEDGQIWSDVFVSENEWRNYRSDTIMRLESDYGIPSEKLYIADAIYKLKRAGWTITD